MAMTKGQVDHAVRDALHRLDEWNEVTGFIPKGVSYQGEIESIVEDAVHIGIRAALGMPYIGIDDEELTGGFIEPVSSDSEQKEQL